MDACSPVTVYRDADGDGAGDGAVTQSSCGAPDGWVSNADDCDDSSSAIGPSADELCDGIDQNCDGAIDDGFACSAGAPVTCTTACGTIGSATCTAACELPDPGACVPPDEVCNYADDDCDGIADPGLHAPQARETYLDEGTTELELEARSDGGFIIAYLTPGFSGHSSIRVQRVDETGNAEGAAVELGTSVWAFGLDSSEGRLAVAWREDPGTDAAGPLQLAVLREDDLTLAAGPATISTGATRTYGGDVGVAINPTSGRVAVVAMIGTASRAFAVNLADLGDVSGPQAVAGSSPHSWSVARGPDGGFLYVSSLGGIGTVELLDSDATRVSTTATFMATGGLIVSPTVRWIADDVGAIAYSVVYGDTPDPRDEVRLALLAGAGTIVDSVQVAARRTPRYLNTILRAVDLAHAGGSWWVAYLGADASGGDSTLSLREVAPTGAGFDLRDHYVEASCDGSGECTELRDSNQSASVSGSGPTLIGASRLSAGPRTVLVGCP
jgi:hypothetical protein